MADKIQGPPEINKYKTNCGVAIDTKKGRVGVGIIIRNSVGEVIACCSRRIDAFVNKNIANLNAIHRGILFGIECGLTPGRIESDNHNVVSWIDQGKYRDSDFGTILADIDAMREVENCFSIEVIHDQANKAALRLAKEVLGVEIDNYWMEEFPYYIPCIVEEDMPG
ncbi:hypothetical protein Ddye_007460 [Dipteronia dyeriana]|uniref:RNase H type-1 domain-containing protein n=1 Tax=Dipteronia dyeriana TaxID=168575 RepID=A0AAE0CRN1_9ROSI|nr:hypothetical protein Ddye_007460 [Dipteronia dyeriana]